MSRYPDSFRMLPNAEPFWSPREDDAFKDAEAAIKKYTDADELEYDFESTEFAEHVQGWNADFEQVRPEIAEAVKSRLAELREGVAA